MTTDKRSDDLVPIDSALGDLDESYLLCRDVHHSWSVSSYAAIGGGAVARELVCARCGTGRVDEWSLGESAAPVLLPLSGRLSRTAAST